MGSPSPLSLLVGPLPGTLSDWPPPGTCGEPRRGAGRGGSLGAMSGPTRGTPEGLVEPLPRPLADALRRAALALRAGERRRRFPATVHVGDPDGAEEAFAFAAGDPDDHALRTDVLAALLSHAGRRRGRHGHPAPLVWVTRPGPLELQDDDAAWLAAARAAGAEAGLPLVFVVVTREGWWDPRSGLRRVWRRLRAR
jgi:hypothetical protein